MVESSKESPQRSRHATENQCVLNVICTEQWLVTISVLRSYSSCRRSGWSSSKLDVRIAALRRVLVYICVSVVRARLRTCAYGVQLVSRSRSVESRCPGQSIIRAVVDVAAWLDVLIISLTVIFACACLQQFPLHCVDFASSTPYCFSLVLV